MKLPPKKKPGDPVLAADWNTLVEALAARTPRPSTGMEIVVSSGGFLYRIKPGALPGIPIPPLVLVPAGKDPESGEFLVSVIPGYVNTLMPTLDGKALDADPRPTLAITGSEPTEVWVQVDGTFGAPDEYDVIIGHGESPPDPSISADGFSATWLLGRARIVTIGAEGGGGEDQQRLVVERVYTGGNLQCDSFGTICHWWRV